MQIRRTGYLVMTAVAVLAMAACTGNDPIDAGSAPLRTSSTQTSEPTTEPDGDEASTTTEATPPTTEPGRHEGSGGTAPPTGDALPFVADTRPDTSPPPQGLSTLVGVDRGEHPGYVRYVFHFEDYFHFEDHDPERVGAAPHRPAWNVRYVPRSQVIRHGSGHPVPVDGAAVLEITFEGASLQWSDGSLSLQGPFDLYDLRFGGAFEGYVTWFLGLDGERPFRAFSTDGDKVVVDVVTP